MTVNDLIERLQELQSNYDRDLEVVTISEIGVVEIHNATLAFSDASDTFENDLITLDEDDAIHVNSVFLEWN